MARVDHTFTMPEEPEQAARAAQPCPGRGRNDARGDAQVVKVCKRGHKRTPDNADSQRHCRICEAERKRAYFQKRYYGRTREDTVWQIKRENRNLAWARRQATKRDQEALDELVRLNPWVLEVPGLRALSQTTTT